ncbi:metallo-beta-lactamase family protein [Desulfonispora thiosulfatigenes DSM 11270]|uniref:Metallo-beta-lactamase family protein n=1 Tax=Desulfonispora thiosulfatigenes DSM 11270 TaxID=656914 RepID=A0A1W1VRP4_DESTI|nr:MBL fold metallo-hydrolase [Desulfonispora thiosulfatigenes]SMB96052.1 metallo-beta-lactamase family protein [Desulfonispora thiosulfatigenes DSM 11270]
MKITFHGAAEFVAGSCFLVECSAGKILIDCGLVQGSRKLKERNYEEFPFNPGEIDAVLLSHAHIDHSGLIPKLYKKGYKGYIYTTYVTKELCSILLPDSGHIQEIEVERKNRKLKRAGKPLLEPIYTVEDAERCIYKFVGTSYNLENDILPGVKAVFKDAGHIMGSAIIELYADGEKLVFSGDLGKENQPIINDPTMIDTADYVIMESTYGNRFHLETEDKLTQLVRIINKTMQKGGNLVIPAFAVERTQDLIYKLRQLVESNEMPDINVYVDSPLAIKATEIFCKFPSVYDDDAKELHAQDDSCIFKFDGLHFTETADESKAINEIRKNAIIISASGMCDAGRIKHHLKHNLWRGESTILFVGYQAEGTLGRRILDGEELVRIHGEEVAVNANIERIEGFSAHADQKGLVDWVKHFSNKPKKIFLVHGETDSINTLAQIIKDETDNEVIVPKLDETFVLDKGKKDLTQVPKVEGNLDIDSIINEFEGLKSNLKEMLSENRKKEIIDKLLNLKDQINKI